MSQPLHPETDHRADAGRAQHPSLANLSDFDAALALAGIRTDARPDRRGTPSVSVPGHRFGAPLGTSWRTRRRSPRPLADRGPDTLLGAHRSSREQPPRDAPAA
jgi:hypothetical protein